MQCDEPGLTEKEMLAVLGFAVPGMLQWEDASDLLVSMRSGLSNRDHRHCKLLPLGETCAIMGFY
jgi:hypothetical protein